MKFILTIFLIILLPTILFSQSTQKFDDYSEIKDRLSDAQIIFLGEESHFDYTSMQEKLELIKFLHDSLQFDLLLFESSLFDMEKANNLLLSGEDGKKALFSGVYSIWHDTRAFHDLASYLQEENKKGSQIEIGGFDSQFYSGEFFNSIPEELRLFLDTNSINYDPEYIKVLGSNIYEVGENYSLKSNFDTTFFNETNLLVNEINNKGREGGSFWVRNLLSIKSVFYNLHYNHLNEVSEESFQSKYAYLRDSLMGGNILYFMEKYPDKKIMCWGATTHLANDVSELQSSDSTFQFFSPAGSYVKKIYGDKVKSIGFVDQVNLSAETQFIEDIDLEINEKALLDFKKIDRIGYSSFLGQHHLNEDYPYGHWNNVLDYGIIINSSKNIVIKGVTVDENTNKVLPFVNIQISNTSKGTISNEKGEFELSIKEKDRDNPLIFNHLGYKKLLLNQSDVKGEIKLFESKSTLEELVITDKGNDPKNILNKVVQQHIDSAYNKLVSYDCYTLTTDSLEGLIYEAAVRVNRTNGYQTQPFKPSKILNKKVYNSTPVYLWPVHTLAEADFKPNYQLLNKKFFKKLLVDSVRIVKSEEESLTYLYFHRKLSKYICSGILIFDTDTYKLKNKIIINKSNSQRNDYWLQSYMIEYVEYNGFMFPKYAMMNYDHAVGDKRIKGSTIFMINEINMSKPKRILFPNYELDKAPSKDRFWKNYNRITITSDQIERFKKIQ